MEKNKFIAFIAVMVIGIGALAVKCSHLIHDSSDEVVTQEKNSLLSSVSGTNRSTGDFLPNLGYSYADYVRDHPVANQDSPKWAKNLFISQQLDAAIRYSRSVLLEGDDRTSIEALPVLMSSYKSIHGNGNSRFTQFIYEYVLHFSSLPPSEANTQRLDDFLSNIMLIVTEDDTYSVMEQIEIYRTLTAPGMPPIAVHYGTEIGKHLEWLCVSNSCSNINASSFSGEFISNATGGL